MYLESDCLEKLAKFMDENEEVAVVSPRLMRWDFNKIQNIRNTHRASLCGDNIQDSFTNKIDTLGLIVSRSRRVTELMTGEDWSGHVKEGDPSTSASLRSAFAQDDAVEVFGVSGAMPLFRKSAIDEVGLFDESFVTYKEDVDLAFRMRSAGHKAFVLLDAVAYHDRTAAGTKKLSIKNKKSQSDYVKYYSYRNHLITVFKNEYPQNYLLDFFFIEWYELRKFLYFLLFDRKVLRGLKDIIKMGDEINQKREEIKKLRKLGWREMRKWYH